MFYHRFHGENFTKIFDRVRCKRLSHRSIVSFKFNKTSLIESFLFAKAGSSVWSCWACTIIVTYQLVRSIVERMTIFFGILNKYSFVNGRRKIKKIKLEGVLTPSCPPQIRPILVKYLLVRPPKVLASFL